MKFFEKLWKMWENIEILNFSQQKKKELFSIRTKLSYYKFFTENLLAIEMKNKNKNKKANKQTNKHKKQILMNKPVQLRLSILELSKILIYEFWHDYVKPKYGDFDMDIWYIKTDYIYKDIAEDVETRFGTSNYKLDKPLPNGKNKKVIGLMKDELSWKIMTKFVGIRAKTYSY